MRNRNEINEYLSAMISRSDSMDAAIAQVENIQVELLLDIREILASAHGMTLFIGQEKDSVSAKEEAPISKELFRRMKKLGDEHYPER